jgi:hypothetical protein
MSEFSHRLRLVSLVLGASVSMTFASTGCVVHRYHSEGPSLHTMKVPPRSAAHGYVHHYRDVVLVFDRSWNGYWVQEYPHYYFHVNHYYRWHGDRWQKARRFGGPWVSVGLRSLPAGLHHRGMAKARRDDHRETARGRREVVKAKREVRRDVVKAKREVRREVVKAKREVRREDKRVVAKEHREAVRERREERRDVAEDQRKERREVAKEQREVVKKHRDEHRETARERREERREVAESERTRRTAKLTGELGRGSARHRRPTVRKAADEELLANRGVE